MKTANEISVDTAGMVAAFESCKGLTVAVEMWAGRRFSALVLGVTGDNGRRTHVRLDGGDTFEVRVADVATIEVL